ncbi:MAG TPA: hypothetical protein VK154_06225 [Chitinophagales bacterium]|nr:hypothetical protein [Chitinophagales bacterium]
MELSDGNVFHVYSRGNQQKTIFFSDANYLYFLRKMEKELLPHANILAYCLMPNHFHWLIEIKSSTILTESNKNMYASGFSKATAVLLRSYARAMQKQQQFTGSLFQQNAKSKLLPTRNDILTCFNYIHNNPLKANLTSKTNDWKFSSLNEYLNTGDNGICNKKLLFELADINHKYDFANQYKDLDEGEAKRIFAD